MRRSFNTRAPRVRHPRIVAGFLMLLGVGCLALVLCGCFSSKNVDDREESGASAASQLEETRAAGEEILKQVRRKEALSIDQISAVQAELDSALGDGKLHVETAIHASGLSESVREFLQGERDMADDVLIWSGYLGLLGKSWGALLKTPKGVEMVTFSECQPAQGDAISIDSQNAKDTVETIEERAALYQNDWT